MLVLLWQIRSTEAYPGCETWNMEARVAWISVAPVKGLALAQRDDVESRIVVRSGFVLSGAPG